MAEYQLVRALPGMEVNHVQRASDGATIPFDEANRDYQEYLEWCAAGGVPDPVAPDPAAEL